VVSSATHDRVADEANPTGSLRVDMMWYCACVAWLHSTKGVHISTHAGADDTLICTNANCVQIQLPAALVPEGFYIMSIHTQEDVS
jgi:hypothetical protein